MKILPFFLIKVVFLLVTLTFPSFSFASDAIHRVHMKDFHQKTLAEDSPVIDMAFDHSKEGLWLLGQKHLWHWNFVEQRLQKYQLKEGSSPATQIAPDKLFAVEGQAYLGVAAGNHLFLVKQKPFRVTEFHIPETEEIGSSLAVMLNSDQECCYWAHSQGVFQVESEKTKLEKVSRFSQIAGKRHDAVLWYHQIWSITDKELYVLDLFTSEERQVYSSKEELLSVHLGQNQDILLLTNQALLRLHANGDIAQIIPQRHGEPLAAVHFDSSTHSYLFRDGLLERYHLPFQHLESHDLRGEGQESFEKTIIQGPFVGTISNNVPSVFIIGAP
ncbi:MAG: hypothetical protein ACOH5I_04865 [Oligoflexus sp.]